MIAQYNANELLTQREMISQKIRDTLQFRLNKFMITLDDTSIMNLSYSHDYQRAVEETQIALQ